MNWLTPARRRLAAYLLLAAANALALYQVGPAREHRDCVFANRGRTEIKQAFEDLYDGFVNATGGSEAAVTFKETRMASLRKGLPQREC